MRFSKRICALFLLCCLGYSGMVVHGETPTPEKEELFKGWKIVITLYDSAMQKELTKSILVK